MNNNLPKFLHSRSVVGGREFIIHTQVPRLICEVFHLPDGVTDIKGVMMLDNFGDANQLAKLMSRMGDWYQYAIAQKNKNKDK